jgi:hypothetical protein
VKVVLQGCLVGLSVKGHDMMQAAREASEYVQSSAHRSFISCGSHLVVTCDSGGEAKRGLGGLVTVINHLVARPGWGA